MLSSSSLGIATSRTQVLSTRNFTLPLPNPNLNHDPHDWLWPPYYECPYLGTHHPPPLQTIPRPPPFSTPVPILSTTLSSYSHVVYDHVTWERTRHSFLMGFSLLKHFFVPSEIKYLFISKRFLWKLWVCKHMTQIFTWDITYFLWIKSKHGFKNE